MAQSNTNYGCAAIVWDRLFGTFLDQGIVEAGTDQPSRLCGRMPVREPEDTAVVPGS